MVWFSNGRALAKALAKATAVVSTIQKHRPFEIWTFLSGLQMVFDKMGSH